MDGQLRIQGVWGMRPHMSPFVPTCRTVGDQTVSGRVVIIRLEDVLKFTCACII
jgi:hypothetical protein